MSIERNYARQEARNRGQGSDLNRRVTRCGEPDLCMGDGPGKLSVGCWIKELIGCYPATSRRSVVKALHGDAYLAWCVVHKVVGIEFMRQHAQPAQEQEAAQPSREQRCVFGGTCRANHVPILT